MLLLGAAICLLPQKQAPKIVFENILKSSGIRYVTDNSATLNKHQVETMLAGVAVPAVLADSIRDPHIAVFESDVQWAYALFTANIRVCTLFQ